MSTVSGIAAKGEKRKPKFQSLDINSLHRGESLEPHQQRSTLPRKHGMQSLGKIPSARRPPANLPSLKSESSGNEGAVSLVPSGSTGWSSQQVPVPTAPSHVVTSQSPAASVYPNVTAVTATLAMQPAAQSSDKLWTSVMARAHPASFPAHQSSQFHHEFPTLSGQAPASGVEHRYGPGPSLRPQTEGSWIQGGGRTAGQPPLHIPGGQAGAIPGAALGPQGTPPPLRRHFPVPLHRPQYPDNRYMSPHRPAVVSEEETVPRHIIKEGDLDKMDDIAQDAGWAACDDNIVDYNQKLLFSDEEEDPATKEKKWDQFIENQGPGKELVMDDTIARQRREEEERNFQMFKQGDRRLSLETEQKLPGEQVEEEHNDSQDRHQNEEMDIPRARSREHMAREPLMERHASSHFKNNLPPRFVKWAGWHLRSASQDPAGSYPVGSSIQGSRNIQQCSYAEDEHGYERDVEADERLPGRILRDLRESQLNRQSDSSHGWEPDSNPEVSTSSGEWRQDEDRQPDSRASRDNRSVQDHYLHVKEGEERREKTRLPPGPITHAKLEAAELHDETKHSLTQLKRSSGNDKKLESRTVTEAHDVLDKWDQCTSVNTIGRQILEERTSSPLLEVDHPSSQSEETKQEAESYAAKSVETAVHVNKVEGESESRQESGARGYTVYQGGNWQPRRNMRGRRGPSRVTDCGSPATGPCKEERRRSDLRRQPRSPKQPQKKLDKEERLCTEEENFRHNTYETVSSSHERELPRRGGFHARGSVGRRVDGYGPPPSKSPFGRPTEGSKVQSAYNEKEGETIQEDNKAKVKEQALGTDVIRSRHYRGGGGGKPFSPQVPPRMQKKSENERWVPGRSKGRGRGRGQNRPASSSDPTETAPGAESDSKRDVRKAFSRRPSRTNSRPLSPTSRAPGAEKQFLP